MYYCIKVDKNTGIVLTDKAFETFESALDFAKEIAAMFGYETSATSEYLYERGPYAITIK